MIRVKSHNFSSDIRNDLVGRLESVLEGLRNTDRANTEGYKILAVVMYPGSTVRYEATIFYEVPE